MRSDTDGHMLHITDRPGWLSNIQSSMSARLSLNVSNEYDADLVAIFRNLASPCTWTHNPTFHLFEAMCLF